MKCDATGMSRGGMIALVLTLGFTILMAACSAGAGCIPGCSGGKLPEPMAAPPHIRPAVVPVEVRNNAISIPHTLAPGPTLFRVTNLGNETQYFEIRQAGSQIMFGLNLLPGATGEIQVNLQPGSYHASCPFFRSKKGNLDVVISVPASGPVAVGGNQPKEPALVQGPAAVCR